MNPDTLFTPLATLWGLPLSSADLLGFATGLASVFLAMRGNIWNFPVGIANCLIMGLTFLQYRLFSDAGLQLLFIALGLQGWASWMRHGQTHEESPVGRTGRREFASVLLLTALVWVALWQLMIQLKGAMPPLDALITALSLAAQWFLNRRHLQSWYWWITVDLISIPLYWSRGLPMIALLYGVFLLLCIQGLRHWRTLPKATAIPTPVRAEAA